MRMARISTAMMVACLCVGLAVAEPETKPEAAKGKIIGLITQKDGGKITVKGETGDMILTPYWRGGMPDKGGGLDKDMVKKLEDVKVGDKVEVEWTFEEHNRIDKIKVLEKVKTDGVTKASKRWGRSKKEKQEKEAKEKAEKAEKAEKTEKAEKAD